MATSPIDRLIFAQGGLCFFCRGPLPRSEASIEHLVAKANGGGNGDDNCVVCCKSLNRLLGSLSLKEKVQIVLNQRGPFRCPNAQPAARAARAPPHSARLTVPAPADDNLRRVIANLQHRTKGRPRTLKTLTSTIASLRIPSDKTAQIVQSLLKLGIVKVSGTKVEYEFSRIGT
jgi:hypothetical protein